MRKNVAWNSFGTVVYCIAQWLITVIVVRMSSYENAGYLALAMSTSTSFSTISLFGVRNYQISDVKGEFTQHEYVGSRILTCGIAFVACAIYSFFRNTPYQFLCISAFMLIRVAEGAVDVLYGEDQKLNRYDIIGKSFVYRGIGLVVFFVLGMLLTKNLLVSIIWMACSSLLIALFYDYRKTSKLEEIKPVIYSEKVKKILLRCAPAVGFGFLLNMENLIPKNVLQQIMGTEIVGYYSSIASPTLVVQILAMVVFTPFLPQLSRIYGDNHFDRFLKTLRKLYLCFAGLTIAVMVGGMLIGRWGLSFLYGESILAYYSLFPPILLVVILMAVIHILSSVLVAMRKIQILLLGMLVDFVFCILFVKPCIEKFGANGTSYIQIMCYGILILFLVIVCESTVQKGKKEAASCGPGNEKNEGGMN